MERKGSRLCRQRYLWIYRNGDFRAHVAAWEKLDQVLVELLTFQDFKKPRTSEDVKNWVKFKFDTVSRFYKQFAYHPIIGGRIDVFCLAKKLS